MLHKNWFSGFTIGMVTAAYAQSVNVRGTVTDAADKPVANAIVELLIAKQKDTTGADGMYSLNAPSIALRHAPVLSSEPMSLERGILELSVARPSPVRIEIFDVKGNILDRMVLEEVSAGRYRLNLAGRVHSEKLLIVKASVGRATKSFPYFAKAEAGKTGGSLEFSAAAGGRLAKVSADVDTLQVTAAGYAAMKVPVSSYDATLDVSMDASSGDRWGGMKNPPMKSSGCGKPVLKSGTFKLTSAGLERQYILNVPANYDASKPSRMIFTMHWMDGSAQAVKNSNFYSYILYDNDTEKNTLLVAPQGYTDGSPWRGKDDKDHIFFEDLHRHLLSNLCVDSSRVFMTGFSFGGMITYASSTTHQDKIRAAAGLAPANYNIYLPAKNHEPIAWMQTTGMKDGTCPWVSSDAQKRGAKYIALEHAADNGCAIPAGNEIPTWKSGGHFCYDFQGCKPGYPVKACTFGGAHTDLNSDPGTSANWLHQTSWKFFMEF